MGTSAALKNSSRSATAGRERNGLRRGLVVAQIALSLVLLCSALLFSRSLAKLLTAETGFRADGLVITTIDASRLKYSPEQRGELYRNLLRRLRAIPEVETVATANDVPISDNYWNERIELLDGRHTAPVVSDFNRVSTQYFQALKTPLVAGRDFTEQDNISSAPVAIVDEAFSRKFLNGASPLGLRIRIVTGPGEPAPSYQVVGVTKNAKYRSVRSEFEPTVFLCEGQRPKPELGIRMVVRSAGSFGPLLADIKQVVRDENPGLIIDFQPLTTAIKETLLLERLMATLSGFFGFLAAALATLGLYGMISYMVERRRSEIGIRMALGADRSTVIKMILSEASVLVLIGCAVGTVLFLAAARFASTLLYGMRATDPLTLIAGLLLLIAVSLVASLIPAMRAARLQPMTALREE